MRQGGGWRSRSGEVMWPSADLRSPVMVPGLSRKARGRPCPSAKAFSFVVQPRAADCLGRSPPFPPAEARCAVTAELSIIATATGHASASAWKMRVHSPRALHRFHQVSIVVGGPMIAGPARIAGHARVARDQPTASVARHFRLAQAGLCKAASSRGVRTRASDPPHEVSSPAPRAWRGQLRFHLIEQPTAAFCSAGGGRPSATAFIAS